MNHIEELKNAFATIYGRSPTHIIRAPGRINLLGAHVDFCDGMALPAAIDRAVWLAVAATDDQVVTIEAVDMGENGRFRLPHLDVQSSSVGGSWINYPVGVAWALQEAGYTLSGMDTLLVSDLPMRSGLSSSAAVEMAFVLAWEALGGFQLDDVRRAQIGQRTENAYLGVGSGIMDQFACVHGRADQFVYLDCRTLAHERLPLPDGVETAVLIVDSGIQRQLTQSGFNRRRAECDEATALLGKSLAHVQALRDVTLDDLELHGHLLPEHLRRRALHVVGEIARVAQGRDALRRGDLAAFGRLVRQSHISSRDNFESSIPELDVLAAAAWQTDGCIAARFGGGGGGGMMQVLLHKGTETAVAQAMGTAFEAAFGRTPPMFLTQIGDGAVIVS